MRAMRKTLLPVMLSVTVSYTLPWRRSAMRAMRKTSKSSPQSCSNCASIASRDGGRPSAERTAALVAGKAAPIGE